MDCESLFYYLMYKIILPILYGSFARLSIQQERAETPQVESPNEQIRDQGRSWDSPGLLVEEAVRPPPPFLKVDGGFFDNNNVI
jgi:hypothetical protein